MNTRKFFSITYAMLRTLRFYQPTNPLLREVYQCLTSATAPTKDDLWQAYYTNAKLDAGYYNITPLMILEAVNAQTELDCTRVYIRKDNGKRCEIEVVCHPVNGWGTFFGFKYMDTLDEVELYGTGGRKTYFKIEHDPLHDGSEFISISFYLWYTPPFKIESGWSNG